MVGLKLTHGGSIPSFLVSLIGFEQKQALRRCDREEGSRVVILRSWMLVLLI